MDMEHGAINVDQLPDLFRAIELGGTLPLARIVESKPKDCKQALDAIIVGPYDLSASMGLTAEFEHKEFLAVMDQIMKLCQQYDVPCGDHVVHPDPQKLERRISDGYRFFAYSIDAVFLYNSSTNPKL